MSKGLHQENINKVPKKAWKKWSDLSQRVFNTTYQAVRYNQQILVHPLTPLAPSKQWNTVAWNTAWTAADAAESAIHDIEAGIGYAE